MAKLPAIAGADQTRPVLRVEFDSMRELRAFCRKAARGEDFDACPGDFGGLRNSKEYCAVGGNPDANCDMCWERALVRNALENAPRREAAKDGMG